MQNKLPKTLLEAITYYADASHCAEFVKNVCYGDAPVSCKKCGSLRVKALSNRQVWQCNDCRKQFSFKLGTIFEDSPLSLSKWIPALWLLINSKNGISSHEVGRALGVTQRTAWFMMHRLRETMRTGTFQKLSGHIEADETFVGGKAGNKHASKRGNNKEEYDAKTVVFGMVERNGNAVAKVVNSRKRKELSKEIHANVEIGSSLSTDALASYDGLDTWYDHSTIDHSAGEYVRGNVHTNSVESFWALFKRTVKGTYIHIESFHTDRYLHEQTARFNLRKTNDATRFETIAPQIMGRRLTWKELTGKAL